MPPLEKNNWKRTIIVLIYKKGDVNNPDNNRSVSNFDHFSKLYIHMINKRVTFMHIFFLIVLQSPKLVFV